MPDVTNTPRRASGKSGTLCTETGPYSSADNVKAANVIVFFRKGERFPPDSAGSATIWTMVSDDQRLTDGRLVRSPEPATP
jgi:hypothetical protein